MLRCTSRCYICVKEYNFAYIELVIPKNPVMCCLNFWVFNKTTENLVKANFSSSKTSKTISFYGYSYVCSKYLNTKLVSYRELTDVFFLLKICPEFIWGTSSSLLAVTKNYLIWAILMCSVEKKLNKANDEIFFY